MMTSRRIVVELRAPSHAQGFLRRVVDYATRLTSDATFRVDAGRTLPDLYIVLGAAVPDTPVPVYVLDITGEEASIDLRDGVCYVCLPRPLDPILGGVADIATAVAALHWILDHATGGGACSE